MKMDLVRALGLLGVLRLMLDAGTDGDALR
jgi:hypothetical protein